MLTTQRPIPPGEIAPGVTPKAELIGVYSNSRDNPRKLPIEGTRDPANCGTITVEVTFYDADGTPIDPNPTSIPVQVNNGEENWSATVTAPEKAVKFDIVVKCCGEVQDSRTDVEFASTIVVTAARPRIFDAAKSGSSAMTMTVNNPAASAPHDSDTIHIIRHLSHGKKNSFTPYSTSNPGSSTRVITVHDLGPGRYSARLVYVPVSGSPVTYAAPVVTIA